LCPDFASDLVDLDLALVSAWLQVIINLPALHPCLHWLWYSASSHTFDTP
jgi:hypothetical protein